MRQPRLLRPELKAVLDHEVKPKGELHRLNEMAARLDHDPLAQGRLSILAQELLQLDEAIAVASAAGAPLPLPLSEVFHRLAAAAEICEQVVEHHASGHTPVRDITLVEIDATLRKVREVTTSLLRIALFAANNQT